MDLTPILICGIFVLGVYKLFELFIRRRERIMLVEKLEGEALNEFIRNGGLPQTQMKPRKTGVRFFVLHIAAAMLGLGTAFVFNFTVLTSFYTFNYDLPWYLRDACNVGSILLFTGLALIISFIVEYRLLQKEQ